MTKSFSYIISLIVISFFISCQKDTVAPEVNITEDDAADVLGSVIASSSKGLITQLAVGVDIADSGEIPGLQKIIAPPIDTTITKQGSFGGYSYQYIARYRYEFSLLSDSLRFQYWLKGAYSTPRVSADDSSWAELRLTQFLGKDSCMINGTYSRLGSHSLKVRDKKQFNSQITATLNNIVFDKKTKQALYGTISFTISGESSTGKAFSYSGILSIYGNIPASLILNDLTYEIDLNTGYATFIPDDDGDDDGGL
jgi:hypothetical protein